MMNTEEIHVWGDRFFRLPNSPHAQEAFYWYLLGVRDTLCYARALERREHGECDDDRWRAYVVIVPHEKHFVDVNIHDRCSPFGTQVMIQWDDDCVAIRNWAKNAVENVDQKRVEK